jgi:DUF1680 family protein
MAVAGERLSATAAGGYPHEGRWILNVETAPAAPVTLHLFVPPWS